MPQQDDHDDLAGLDFYDADVSDADEHGREESDPFDFSGADDDGGEEAAIDAVDEFAPTVPGDTGGELAAVDAQAGDGDEDKEVVQLFRVGNPPETVWVSTAMGGRIQRIELSPNVASMTESELADEILVVADLARQKGLAGQHTYMFEVIQALGIDDAEAARELLEEGLDLSSPEQAEEAQAEVFSTRYNTDRG
jgi:hypothetical protein